MAIIKKKTWPEYFEVVLQEKKNFELRLNDFEVKEGDVLVLEEYDPKKKKYTGRKIEKKVTYVFKFHPNNLPFYSKEEVKSKGLQIISLN